MNKLFAAAITTLAAVSMVLGATTRGNTEQSPSSWPQRTVKFILPLGPGSGVDITARLLADRLAARWGKPVVVENRPGGDGFVAITAFTSAADDHTLLFTPTSSFTAHPFLHDKLPYDPADLVPIARVSNTLIAIGVPASLGVATLAELAARARAEPGKMSWAGTTGATDFMFEGFLRRENLDIAKIPYRDGVQALNDLAEGRIHVYAAALAIMRPQVQAGRVKPIAIMNRERAPAMAEVPTVAEAGFPAARFDGLVGLFGPRSLSDSARNQIAKDIQTAASDPEVVGKLTTTGQLVRPSGPAEFAAAIDEQRATLAGMAKTLGIKLGQ